MSSGAEVICMSQTSTVSTALRSCKVIPEEPQSANTDGCAQDKHSFH